MSSVGEIQAARVLPPRRGKCIALAVDATARPYSLATIDFAGYTPEASATRRKEVYVTLQAVSGDVWLYFHTATANDLDPAAVVSAGGTLAYANTYGDRIPQNGSIQVVLDRSMDKFLVCRTSTGTATLLIRASSENT